MRLLRQKKLIAPVIIGLLLLPVTPFFICTDITAVRSEASATAFNIPVLIEGVMEVVGIHNAGFANERILYCGTGCGFFNLKGLFPFSPWSNPLRIILISLFTSFFILMLEVVYKHDGKKPGSGFYVCT